jgi:hypothetical protein
LVFHLHDCDREGYRYDVIRQTGALERALDLIRRRVLHKSVLEVAIPYAVINLCDLHIPDLEFMEALVDQLRVRIALRLRGADEFERTVKAKRGRGRGGRKYKIAA